MICESTFDSFRGIGAGIEKAHGAARTKLLPDNKFAGGSSPRQNLEEGVEGLYDGSKASLWSHPAPGVLLAYSPACASTARV